jgi:chorismate mutase
VASLPITIKSSGEELLAFTAASVGSGRRPAIDPSADPIIRQLREQVSDNDRALIEAINTRLRLVARLKEYKDSRGLDFVDPDREESMLRDMGRANRGPLSAEGLEEIYRAILDLAKREVS